MKKIFISLLILIFFLFKFSFADVKVNETILSNGLKIVTSENHTAPVVTFMVWYKVGSRNERPGITGISHLLEHMLFKSTKNFPNEKIFQIVQENGGICNGFTSEDYTAYFETLASDRIEIAVQVEAERMINGIMNPIAQKPEITVVKSELEGGDNDPVSLLWKNVQATAFLNHSYRWPVIGWVSDLININKNDLENYYKTYYVPNNATIVAVGDFRTENLISLIKKYFGKIKEGNTPPEVREKEPPQLGERRIKVRKEGNTEYVLAVYHIPEINNPDILPLNVLSQILSAGQTSRLHKKLVLGDLATSVYSSAGENKDPGLFIIFAQVRKDKNVTDVEKAMLEEIEKIKKEGITQEEFDKAIEQMEAEHIYSKGTVTSIARALGYYETISSYKNYVDFLENLKKVKIEDINRVANQYFSEDNRTIGHFVPTAPLEEKEEKTEIPDKVAYYRPPENIPQIYREVLDNGMVVIIMEDHTRPTVTIRGGVKAGFLFDTKEKYGVSVAVPFMLSRGTTNRTLLQIADELEKVGAYVNVTPSVETAEFSGFSRSKDFPKVIKILADILQNPSFPQDELERGKLMAGTVLNSILDDPEARAALKALELIYPETHLFHAPKIKNIKKIIQNMKREDLVEFHKNYYGGETAIMVIVGDIKKDEALEIVRKSFSSWHARTPKKEINLPDVPLLDKERREIIDMPGKSQVNCVLGYNSPLTRINPDYYAADVMNKIFGGLSITSRLYKKLRVEKGYVYYVRSGFLSTLFASGGAGLTSGPWGITFGVNKENMDDAIKIVIEEMKKIREKGVTKDELNSAIKYITGSFPLRLESQGGLANALYSAEYFSLGLDYPWNFKKHYENLTLEQINEAAKKYIHPDNLVITIAGPYGQGK